MFKECPTLDSLSKEWLQTGNKEELLTHSLGHQESSLTWRDTQETHPNTSKCQRTISSHVRLSISVSSGVEGYVCACGGGVGQGK